MSLYKKRRQECTHTEKRPWRTQQEGSCVCEPNRHASPETSPASNLTLGFCNCEKTDFCCLSHPGAHSTWQPEHTIQGPKSLCLQFPWMMECYTKPQSRLEQRHPEQTTSPYFWKNDPFLTGRTTESTTLTLIKKHYWIFMTYMKKTGFSRTRAANCISHHL